MGLNISTVIFIIATVLAFYLVPRPAKKPVLLLSSLLFCFYLDPAALAVLILVTLLTYAAGLSIEKTEDERSEKLIFTAVISLLILILLAWKFLPFLHSDLSSIVLPVGLSFYTFQAISYLSDIRTGKQAAEKNIISFGIYMTWFPKLISGPIERADSFLSGLKDVEDSVLFDGSRVIKALSFILWGMFMKLMIADRAGIIVDGLFAEPEKYGAAMLMMGSLFYTVQIYCDFAGYTDIMIGISVLYGIDLSQNFNLPYLSCSISDFWKRWHITLSTFLRDYIYIPLGGNRKGRFRKYINLMIVFFVSGLWHGRGLSFIVWGLLHGLYSVLEDLVKNTRIGFLVKSFAGRGITFIAVSFAWIFFRADSLHQAFVYIRGMFTARDSDEVFFDMIKHMGSSKTQLIILIVSLVILIAAEIFSYRKGTLIPGILEKTGEIRRDTVFLVLAVIILIFGVYGDPGIGKFIYMNF